jgi:hypothetical protein
MPVFYRDAFVGEVVGWAKQIDLPHRLQTLLNDPQTPPEFARLARVGLAFLQEDRIQFYVAEKVLQLSETAFQAGFITAPEKEQLLDLIRFDPEEERLAGLADQWLGRIEEVENYELNLRTLEARLEQLRQKHPQGWPQELQTWRQRTLPEVYADLTLSDEQVQQLVELLEMDQLQRQRRSTLGELAKAREYRDHLANQLPQAQRDELYQKALKRRQLRKVSAES